MSFNEGFGFNFNDNFEDDQMEFSEGLVQLEIEDPDETIEAYVDAILNASSSDEVASLVYGLFHYGEKYGVRETLFEQIMSYSQAFGMLSGN